MEKQSEPTPEKWRHKCYGCGNWHDAPKGESTCPVCKTSCTTPVRPSLEQPEPDPTPTPEEEKAANDWLTAIKRHSDIGDFQPLDIARLLASRRVKAATGLLGGALGSLPSGMLSVEPPVNPDALELAKGIQRTINGGRIQFDIYSLAGTIESFAAGKVAEVTAECDALRMREKEARELIGGLEYWTDDEVLLSRAKAWLAGGGK